MASGPGLSGQMTEPLGHSLDRTGEKGSLWKVLVGTDTALAWQQTEGRALQSGQLCPSSLQLSEASGPSILGMELSHWLGAAWGECDL